MLNNNNWIQKQLSGNQSRAHRTYHNALNWIPYKMNNKRLKRSCQLYSARTASKSFLQESNACTTKEWNIECVQVKITQNHLSVIDVERSKSLSRIIEFHLTRFHLFIHSFKTKSIIHNHLNVVHLRIKRYQCNVCGFAMYSKTHHKNHSKTHTNTKDFKCSQCAKEFIRKESLVVHLR